MSLLNKFIALLSKKRFFVVSFIALIVIFCFYYFNFLYGIEHQNFYNPLIRKHLYIHITFLISIILLFYSTFLSFSIIFIKYIFERYLNLDLQDFEENNHQPVNFICSCGGN